MEIEHLFHMLESNRLCLVSPHLWEDPFETFFNYCLTTSLFFGPTSYESCGKLIYGQCWTYQHESDALWRIYSPKKNRVRIKTTVRKLITELEKIQTDGFYSFIGKIHYQETSDIETKIQHALQAHIPTIIFDHNLINNFLFVKRKTFEHEDEVRLIVSLRKMGEEQVKEFLGKNDQLCSISIESSIDLIDEIVFDPRIDDSVFASFKDRLINHYMFTKPIKKSTIYDPPKISVKRHHLF